MAQNLLKIFKNQNDRRGEDLSRSTHWSEKALQCLPLYTPQQHTRYPFSWRPFAPLSPPSFQSILCVLGKHSDTRLSSSISLPLIICLALSHESIYMLVSNLYLSQRTLPLTVVYFWCYHSFLSWSSIRNDLYLILHFLTHF